jgi:hypothetical protein
VTQGTSDSTTTTPVKPKAEANTEFDLSDLDSALQGLEQIAKKKEFEPFVGLGMYDFNATREDELSFKKGIYMKVLQEEMDGWYFAEISSKQGLVPGNFVKKVCEITQGFSSFYRPQNPCLSSTVFNLLQ